MGSFFNKFPNALVALDEDFEALVGVSSKYVGIGNSKNPEVYSLTGEQATTLADILDSFEFEVLPKDTGLRLFDSLTLYEEGHLYVSFDGEMSIPGHRRAQLAALLREAAGAVQP